MGRARWVPIVIERIDDELGGCPPIFGQKYLSMRSPGPLFGKSSSGVVSERIVASGGFVLIRTCGAAQGRLEAHALVERARGDTCSSCAAFLYQVSENDGNEWRDRCARIDRGHRGNVIHR
jgi:hypothetical protein